MIGWSRRGAQSRGPYRPLTPEEKKADFRLFIFTMVGLVLMMVGIMTCSQSEWWKEHSRVPRPSPDHVWKCWGSTPVRHCGWKLPSEPIP